MILCPMVWFFPQLSFVNYLLPLVWGFWLCVVVTETELEEKIIPLLVLFFVWQIPVHRFVHRALVVQIARVTFSGVPFCHGWIWLPFLKRWGEGGCQVMVWCTLTLDLAPKSMYFNAFFGNFAVFLKTGSIITQIKSVWSSNQQWLVHWVTLLHNKKSQHCWLTRIADQGEWIPKKKTILQESRCKNWRLVLWFYVHWY